AAILATITLGVAIGLFSSNKTVDPLNLADIGHAPELLQQMSEVGYSFWLAVGALVCCIIDIVVGSMTVTMANYCL
ncbi:hypothetical protein AB6A40_008976, partial [Gnathostoma spinigerum]